MSISRRALLITGGVASLASGILVLIAPPPSAQTGVFSRAKMEVESSPLDVGNGGQQGRVEASSALNTDLMPAALAFTTADAALQAIDRGIRDGDTLLIEQFREIDAGCAWREELYGALRGRLNREGLSREQILYMGEILATSEEPENVRFLLQRIDSSGTPEEVEGFSHAAQLSCGGTEVTRILADALDSGNQKIRTAAVGALTNQGTREAAQILYEHTAKSGNGAFYARLGIGLGEMIPDEEAVSYLSETAAKREPEAPYAVFALLNAGSSGLRRIFIIFSVGGNSEQDAAILREGVGHVLLDKESETFVRERLADKNAPPAIHEFARKILERFDAEPELEEPLENATTPG